MFFKSGTVFSKYIHIMIKRIVLLVVLISSLSINAQKPQRIGYIDMEYILENIPEYIDAQANINAKALTWNDNIDKKQNEIDDLKADLRNEKVLLTPELIEERVEDIEIKEVDLRTLKSLYFGTNGDLFFLRKQLVEPIQDLVYNAVQDIAVKRKYDFVLDKSTDLIMLYTNKQYDISDLVITSITRAKKVNEANIKRSTKKNGSNDVSTPEVVSDEAQKKLDAKDVKRAELQKRLEVQKAEKLKQREELLKANEAKKQERIKEIEEANKAKENKNN